MSSCSCSPDVLTSVSFDDGTVLQRCPAHEQQRWLVDGQPVTGEVALSRLRELFVQERHGRAGRPPHPRPRRDQVIRLPECARVPHPSPGDATSEGYVDDAALTAHLRARGLSGTWAVA